MRIKTTIISGDEAREKMQAGAKKVHDPVASSLGPSGMNVAIAYANENGIYGRIVMCDGVTIARSIELEDENENFGAQIIKEATRKTVDAVGDGTTVSAILSYSILAEINKLVVAGYDPMLLRPEIEKSVAMLIEDIKKQSIPVKTLEQKKQIANISAKDKELGDLIANTIHDMGVDGLVVPEESTSSQTTADKQPGFQFDKGFAADEFMTSPDRGEATIEDAHILITDEFINTLDPIKDLLQECAEKKLKLVIIAGQYSLLAAGLMIKHKGSGALSSLLIEAPGMAGNQKNTLQDIAILTKGTFFSQSTGKSLSDATLADLGRCEYVKSTKTETLIVGGIGSKEDIRLRVAEIKKNIEEENADYDKDKLRERLARFTSGVTVIRVGGQTEVEMKERMERVKDAIAATQSAVRHGIVPGGEVVYLVAREKLDQKDIAQNILYKALYQPFKILLTNASMDDGQWSERLRSTTKQNPGINVVKKEIIDMVEEGIIDPSQVSIEALRNGASTAILMATTGFIINQRDADKK